MWMKVKRLHENAIVPTRAHSTDAGLDVYCVENEVVYPNRDKLIRTGISIAIPDGWVAVVKEKSGIATKKKLTVGANVIDCDYRGELLIHLFNNSDTPATFIMGDKIAQLVVVPCWVGQPEEVESLDETSRGDGGFGSTDKRISFYDVGDGKMGVNEIVTLHGNPFDYINNTVRKKFSEELAEDLNSVQPLCSKIDGEWVNPLDETSMGDGGFDTSIGQKFRDQAIVNANRASKDEVSCNEVTRKMLDLVDDKHGFGELNILAGKTTIHKLTRKTDTPKAKEYWDSIDRVASQTDSWSEEKKLYAQAWLNKNVRKETDKQNKPKIEFTEFSMNDCPPQCKYTQKYIEDCTCGKYGFCEFDIRHRQKIEELDELVNALQKGLSGFIAETINEAIKEYVDVAKAPRKKNWRK